MEDHPDLTESDLAGLERGELPAGPLGLEAAVHLRARCATCLARYGSRLAPVLDPRWDGDSQATLSPHEDRQYEFVFRLALQKVKKNRPEIDAALVRARREVEGTALLVEGRFPRGTPALRWSRSQGWLEKAKACRRGAPEEYFVFATLAAAYSLGLEPAEHPAGDAADLQALAIAEAANGHRRAKRFAEAEALLADAIERAREGTGTLPVALEIARRTASLLVDRRRYEEAGGLLLRTFAGYESLGLRHEAGQQTVLLGVVHQCMGAPRLALEAFLQALDRIDGAREPELAVAVVHNVLRSFLELELWLAAERLLPGALRLSERYGSPLDRLKLAALEARLLAGLGRSLEAGRAYEDVIAEFERHRQHAESAVVRLELAALYLSRRRFDRARLVLEDVREVFESIGIHREALGALLLLKEAVEGERATIEMVRRVMAAVEVGIQGK